ncbi:hypothetical protein ES332_D09G072000v1 [Gossypium tomentosum]|uniref:Uncharacterized protein n=1 Tax=Gossypium tomentosum TaxID=34277 RepID=A0A5D2JEK3_GOSTO|nr:hypothetical protein ES332_D09G072000v1 [Gossypium tomentosum]
MLSGKRLRIVIACKMAMETLPLELVRARRNTNEANQLGGT